MTLWTTYAALAGLGLGALLQAQEPPAKEQQEPQAERRQDEQDKTSIADAIRDLGSDSYRTRLEAEKRLRSAGKAAVEDLRKAAENDADPEAQWRARRLLRQIERGEQGGLGRRDAADRGANRDGQRPGGQWRTFAFPDDDVERRFDALFRQLESDFGMDIPRGRFFHDDFFQDLRQQMDALRGQMQPGAPGGKGQSMSMRMGPEGVRVEVKSKNEKGEEETKVYEAPDLESFREKHPGILEQSGLGGGLRFFVGGDGVKPFVPRLDLGDRAFDFGRDFAPFRGRTWTFPPQPGAGSGEVADTDAAPAVPPADRRLGILVRPEIAPEVREALGLEDGRGLMVDEVQPDSLAEALGLQRGDIVLEVAGKTIRGAGDVQDAVGGVATGKSVDVKFLRKGKEKTASAEKTARAEAKDGAKGESKDSEPSKLEPRTSK